MTRRAGITIAVGLVVLVTTGCSDPYTAPQPTIPTARSGVQTVAPPSDTARPHPSDGPGTASAPSARAAIARFATRWINWDWRSVATQQRALARLATGQLAQQLNAGAQNAHLDASLARDQPSSRGAIVTTNLRSSHRSAAGLAVTREQTYTAGHPDLGGAHYHVYLVQVNEADGRWAVSEWEPQP